MEPKARLNTILLIGLILTATLPAAVSATNATQMSFSDLGLTGPQTVQVYMDGMLVGTYNSTTDSIPLPDHDFQVIIKPELKTHWFNPQTFVTDLFAFFATYWEALMLVAIVAGIVILVSRR